MRKTGLLKMTSVEYDLDTSGGLMPQIQALLAPPANEDAKRLKKERERRSISHRRPGRAVNHDTCDSCKEGGDLLCCDHCPAAFHLQCHDPPLEEDELPLGEWICHQCRMFAKGAIQWVEEDDAVSISSSYSRHSCDNVQLDRASISSSGHGKEIVEVVEMDFCEDSDVSVVSRLLHVVHGEEDGEGEEEEKERMEEVNEDNIEPRQEEGKEIEDEEDVVDESPLQTLIRVASIMNPKQFQLPNELQCTTVLPGSHSGRPQGPHKRQQKKESNKAAAKKMAYELDNGIVPLPARLCFECRKSCRKAPLIQCDFCSLLFHQDCLDPPLTVMPVGRWMCPNHPEHILDQKLLSSVSLTERVKLWDKFSGNLSQDAIKVNFLRKIHQHHPPFRYKLKLPPRNRVQVPQAIKDQYKNPPKLLPRVTEPLPQFPDSYSSMERETSNESEAVAPTPEEQDAWLASVVSLHTGIARFLVQRQISRNSRSDNNNNTSSESGATNNGVSNSVSNLSDSGDCMVPVAVVAGSSASVSPVIGVGSPNYTSFLTKGGTPTTAGSVANSRVLINGSVHPPDNDVLPFPVLGNSAPTSTTNGNLSEQLPKPNSDSSVFKAGKARSAEGCSIVTAAAKTTLPVRGAGAVPSFTYSNQGKSIILSPVNKSAARFTPAVASSTTCSSWPLAAAAATATQAQKSAVCKTPLHSISNPMFILQTKVPQYASAGDLQTSVVKSTGATKQLSVNAIMGKVSATSPNSSLLTAKVNVANTISNSPAITNLNNVLQSCIEAGGDVELSKLDEKLVQILAWQRLQQLLPSRTPVASGETKPGLPSKTPSLSNEVRVRASLCPVGGKGHPTLMPYRVLSIGTGADMDMCLTNYGHCNYISPRHACIFYDEMTKHYELLNYSEHGTTVDNVLYSCDFSDKCTVAPPPTSVVAAVRGIIDKFRGRPEPSVSQRFTMNSEAAKMWRPCNCKRSSSSLIGGSGAGWEGTALLHHGSYVKCGCLQFVFSITECATKDSRRIFLERKVEGTADADAKSAT